MQLSFDFPFEDNYLTEDFLTSKSNQEAFDFVYNYSKKDPKHNSDLPKIFGILGPENSGKTHLAHIWKRNNKAIFLNPKDLENSNLDDLIRSGDFYIIEDIDKIPNQKILLHIYNLILEKSSYLLVSSTLDLQNISFILPDLASRFKNIFTIKIKDPDEELIKMLFIKNFAVKQLQVSTNVIDYLAKNVERRFTSISKTIKILEFYCFEEKREITIPMALKALKTINSTIYQNINLYSFLTKGF